ncbi:sugar ABC transporter ATP-binding protein [Rubripirellula reticaptiva]|uniref:Ribose import ATP-binding protein RbsA n=1 Tax=Rubripirellula reticaptiva TaxID=2528013 RepID=A0A5C6F601_9BACT|nr:sugar ABC transporter ATP-binding protein [Rubripirellula reticaptiva]TWU55857.1 Ribose import ATP-binding protein RbsA [Rubripirellula reticaptiva]
MKPLFTVTDITKRFGSVTVLDGVSLNVRAGEIHALLGANGAGKSTLCKIIAGLLTRDGGAMSIANEKSNAADAYLPRDKQTAERAGMQIVQQELNQVSTLTVAENIFLTRMPSVLGVIRKRQLADRARQILDRFDLNDVATDAIMGTLGVGRQQMIEIATALDRQCRLLILDEPTAALGVRETERLFERLRALRDQGIGIIYISHRLDEVAELSDRITVLRDGKHVCTEETSSLTTDDMVNLMAGKSTGQRHSFHSYATGETAMHVSGITAGVVQDISFSVRHGERLGIAGLVGSGRTELLRAVFGADIAEQGTVQVGDRLATRFSHPRQAVTAGLAMVTEDRKQNGLLLRQPIRFNTSIGSLGKRFASLGVIRKQRERQAAEAMARKLETKCNNIDQLVATLSGGNQQKVAISKWLVRDAEVFLFDEPTRGIDVAARRQIYRLIESLAQAGKAIVIVSSDLDELLETCDRIGVISAGKWIADFQRGCWSSDQIMQAAFAGYRRAEAIA